MSSDDPRQKLSRVVTSLVDDVMSTTDEEILNESRVDDGDPEALAAEVRKELSAAMAAAGKRRLAEARKQLNGVRALRNHPSITGLSLTEKESILRKFSANDNPLQQKLTMAARNGDGLTEQEIDSILVDLMELGALGDVGYGR